MRFLMFVCVDTVPVPPPDEPGDVDEWVETMDTSGVRITGNPTASGSDVRVVRVRDGETVVTDGPFIETKEVLAGFDLLECRDLAHAIEVAAAHPMAATGVIEVRQILDD